MAHDIEDVLASRDGPLVPIRVIKEPHERRYRLPEHLQKRGSSWVNVTLLAEILTHTELADEAPEFVRLYKSGVFKVPARVAVTSLERQDGQLAQFYKEVVGDHIPLWFSPDEVEVFTQSISGREAMAYIEKTRKS